MNSALFNLENKLKSLRSKKFDKPYFAPLIWIDPENKNNDGKIEVKPVNFFLDQIAKIRRLSKNECFSLPDKDWTKHAVIYNLFVRYATAFDHDNDGVINTYLPDQKFRETGSFLKSLAILPYLHFLGINTIYLLPVASIGVDGRKGSLGSPYAIRNPYKLDENLGEPILQLPVEEQFAAFVEAAHLLGMKVVLEFVFRTASIDSDLALDNPDWFYWIDDKTKIRELTSYDEKKYDPPVFSTKELEVIKEKVANNDFIDLPAPHKDYIDQFTEIPKKVARVGNKVIGVIGEIKKTFCKIPPAFADWPPDDNQPPWSDVSYLRLYDHPAFNYIAYNTVRMYDNNLRKNQYRVDSLWNNICNIIPYYQQNFNIDGVMIDMGHALPKDLKKMIVNTSRKEKPDFVFWEENFELSDKSISEGYDAALGYLAFDLHHPNKVQQLIKLMSDKGSPIPFFGSAETHNTHRAAQRTGNIDFSKFAWTLVCFIPSLPFVLNGFELAESIPINTGLGFSPDEIQNYTQEKLPLFSVSALNWESKNEFASFIKKILDLRYSIINCDNNFNPNTIDYITASSQYIITFIRKFNDNQYIFIANMHPENELYFSLKIDAKNKLLIDMFKRRIIHIANGWIIYNLKPFDFIIGELKQNV